MHGNLIRLWIGNVKDNTRTVHINFVDDLPYSREFVDIKYGKTMAPWPNEIDK